MSHRDRQTIVLASRNPVKIRAARNGFEKAFPHQRFDLEPVSVASGVASQPFSDEETLLGAENRTARANELHPGADYWIGMEGGIAEEADRLVAFAWVVVRSAHSGTEPSSGRASCGRSRTATFTLPERVAELVRAGHELGEADDLVFGRTESKKRDGAVGLLTSNALDRAELYEPSVILSLIPFMNPVLYP